MKRLIISVLFLLGATLIFSQAEGVEDTTQQEIAEKEMSQTGIVQVVE